MQGIRTRKATEEDYRYCYSLNKRNMAGYFRRHWGGWKPSVFRKDYKPNDTTIITKDGRRIGFYVFRKEERFIDNIQLSIRGKGIGSYVMGLIERREKGNITLEVFKDNPAKRFYERFGYRKLKDKGSSIIMAKDLQ